MFRLKRIHILLMPYSETRIFPEVKFLQICLWLLNIFLLISREILIFIVVCVLTHNAEIIKSLLTESFYKNLVVIQSSIFACRA